MHKRTYEATAWVRPPPGAGGRAALHRIATHPEATLLAATLQPGSGPAPERMGGLRGPCGRRDFLGSPERVKVYGPVWISPTPERFLLHMSGRFEVSLSQWP